MHKFCTMLTIVILSLAPYEFNRQLLSFSLTKILEVLTCYNRVRKLQCTGNDTPLLSSAAVDKERIMPVHIIPGGISGNKALTPPEKKITLALSVQCLVSVNALTLFTEWREGHRAHKNPTPLIPEVLFQNSEERQPVKKWLIQIQLQNSQQNRGGTGDVQSNINSLSCSYKNGNAVPATIRARV